MKAKEAVASALQTTTDAAASRNLVQSQQQQQQLVPQLKSLASKLELTVKAVVLWMVLHMDEEEGMVTAAINHRITIMGCSNRQQVPWKAQTLIKPCCQLCLSLHHLSRLCYTMQSDRWVWCQDHPPPIMPMKLPLLPINTFCRA
jgi:hypothetical protein